MTTKFCTNIVIHARLECVLDVLQDPDSVVGRLTAAQREDPVLKLHSVNDTLVRSVAAYRIPLSTMPGWMASKFGSGGPLNERTEQWTLGPHPFGSVKIHSDDSGSNFSGTYTLTAQGDTTQWLVEGEVDYPAPFIGKRVEKFTVDSFESGYELEARFLAVHTKLKLKERCEKLN